MPKPSTGCSDNSESATGSSWIASQIREEILTGRLEAGVRVTEGEISRRFRVGRSLAREAVHQLSSQGLLTTRPNCGAVVAPEAPREIRSLIIPIRRTLELHALRLIFDELRAEDFAHWEGILERMRIACERHDHAAIAETDIAFHRYLLERAGQPDLILIWETLAGRIRSHFRRTQRRLSSHLLEIHEEHRVILNALRGRDLAHATKVLREKIS